MNPQEPRARPNDERRQRWLGIAGAVAVIAIPIALIVATWRPLEPPPRNDRPAVVEVEEEQAPEIPREERRNRRDTGDSGERTPRRDRDRDEKPAPVFATPFP